VNQQIIPSESDPVNATPLALDIQGLRKSYDEGVEALKGVDLQVGSGDFFALLGPNGAGKSTLIGIVASLVRKSAGAVRVYGHDLDMNPGAVRAHIGLVPQEFNFNVFEPVLDVVTNSAGYHGVARRVALERAEHYLKLLDLWEKRKERSRSLSGGMKRRLMIARALVHEPQLLILDEPTAGVDIEIRRSMWEFLERINNDGKTIILTTHYLEEAEALCRNVAVIDNGEVIRQGRVSDLLSEAVTQSFLFDLENPGDLTIDGLGHAIVTDAAGQPSPTVQIHDKEGKAITLRWREEGQLEAELPRGATLNRVFELFAEHGVGVASMRTKSNRLESFFLQLVDGSETPASVTDLDATVSPAKQA